MKKAVIFFLLGAVVGGLVALVALKRETAPAASDEPPPGLSSVINPDTATIVKQMAEIGLKTAQPAPVELAPEIKGYGRVLDSVPLITLVGEVQAATSAATASAREYERTKALYDQGGAASLQAAETAGAAMQRDRLQVASAQARLLAGWGSEIAGRPDLNDLVGGLAAGTVALVRIDLPAGDATSATPKSARVSGITGDPSWQQVDMLGLAPSMDAQSGGVSYLALWREKPLRPGTALQAILTLPGAPRKALEVAKNAVVRYQGGTFVYVQVGPNFDRKLVTLGPSRGDNVAVVDGLTGNETVVVTGAQQMLATEIMGSKPSEE